MARRLAAREDPVNRFIVGTGRCGSTLLSTMIGENPAVLSLFEYFNGLDGTRRFRPEPMSGAEYRDLICEVHPFLHRVLERGYDVPEVTYPFGRLGARFTRQGGVPWVLGVTLPRLSEQPDVLYDALRAWLERRPALPPVEQARALFAWLLGRMGRSVWVERSGGSLDYLGELDRCFPGSRFLHIHRTGEEAALSMREHHAYRLAIMLTYQLPPGAGRSTEELRRAAPDDDRIGQMLESRPSAEYFGRFWTEQVRRGMAAVPKLERERYHEVRFEDLVARPKQTIREVADFLELPHAGGAWLDAAAAKVRGVPPSRVLELPPDEAERLREACRPGNALLGRA
jgi:putative sulfotransferase